MDSQGTVLTQKWVLEKEMGCFLIAMQDRELIKSTNEINWKPKANAGKYKTDEIKKAKWLTNKGNVREVKWWSSANRII